MDWNSDKYISWSFSSFIIQLICNAYEQNILLISSKKPIHTSDLLVVWYNLKSNDSTVFESTIRPLRVSMCHYSQRSQPRTKGHILTCPVMSHWRTRQTSVVNNWVVSLLISNSIVGGHSRSRLDLRLPCFFQLPVFWYLFRQLDVSSHCQIFKLCS